MHTPRGNRTQTQTKPRLCACVRVEGSTVGDDVGVVVVGEVVGVVVFPVNSNNGMIERTHTTHRKRHNRQKDTKE
jgi:hypothetical protein